METLNDQGTRQYSKPTEHSLINKVVVTKTHLHTQPGPQEVAQWCGEAVTSKPSEAASSHPPVLKISDEIMCKDINHCPPLENGWLSPHVLTPIRQICAMVLAAGGARPHSNGEPPHPPITCRLSQGNGKTVRKGTAWRLSLQLAGTYRRARIGVRAKS
jgi:hypothetical protein